MESGPVKRMTAGAVRLATTVMGAKPSPLIERKNTVSRLIGLFTLFLSISLGVLWLCIQFLK